MSGDGVCRDWERGVCDRGDRCKFDHPKEMARDKPALCKDFQNKGCDRHKCKFLHLTRDEERRYTETKELPPHRGRSDRVAEMNSRMGGGFGGGYRDDGPRGGRGGYGPPMGRGGDDRPPCKDFLNNKCDRGRSCKFRHATEREMALERDIEVGGGRDFGGPSMYGKRRRMEDDGMMEENEMLKRKITDLQKQVLDLREMNDTLYEQNNKYRTQLRM